MKEVKIYTIVSDQLSPPITGESFCIQFGNIYEAMLAAAPQQEVK